jgi:hypothetical protein
VGKERLEDSVAFDKSLHRIKAHAQLTGLNRDRLTETCQVGGRTSESGLVVAHGRGVPYGYDIHAAGGARKDFRSLKDWGSG